MIRNFIVFIFIVFSTPVNSQENLADLLKDGNKLIFIRHAYAPGNGDPENFKLNDCSTQRNLNNKGIIQSKEIGQFFSKNNIRVDKVLSSEWCRCKDTALHAFKNFETKTFLNSFYDISFQDNKETQVTNLKNYIKEWHGKKNLILITHYVVINEILNVSPNSGEIIISDIEFNVIGNFIK